RFVENISESTAAREIHSAIRAITAAIIGRALNGGDLGGVARVRATSSEVSRKPAARCRNPRHDVTPPPNL
ncbi:MAG: hypothetical protein KC466_16725, partial [Myxococcales bacterium]|nr:hypothetical protein [Myxococcales bacterium]